MDEREALTRAVAAAPDDDLPRLVFADWLEEHDEPAHAAFVRAQVELAATPPWEPFAVRLRHREPDLVTGAPWWYALPRVDGERLEWHLDHAFRRGFGWSLIVRDVAALLAEAPRLFDLAPIGQLHLPSATLDQWKHFAAQPWLPRVKSLHFYGTRTPIEPVRVLCDAPLATGLEEIVFERAGSHALPELVAGLFRSPLGQRLRSLEFRVGYESLEELIAAFAAGPAPRLDRLAFVITRFAPEHIDQLVESPVLDSLTALEITHSGLGEFGLRSLARCPRLTRLTRLTLSGVVADPVGAAELAASPHLTGLRMLNLSRNWRGGTVRPGAWSGLLGRLRSLDLGDTALDGHSVEVLVAHWDGLVELKLDNNRLRGTAGRHLLDRPPPPELTALSLRGNRFSDGLAHKLRRHFGERVIL
ncbi:MAG TPA: TIGR02996 domain-containing protein [Fimbriiglobus sp.]|nr:TIGR02996 domain-containing protein [Fimbriiglobus sp.]